MCIFEFFDMTGSCGRQKQLSLVGFFIIQNFKIPLNDGTSLSSTVSLHNLSNHHYTSFIDLYFASTFMDISLQHFNNYIIFENFTVFILILYNILLLEKFFLHKSNFLN